ncbi:hypothetical protein EON83_11100 [bacterium]|nr:MAG: hypothetical protein EON83_11100 [bacterium]
MLPPSPKIKDVAEFAIRAYQDDYIPKVTSHHYSIADVFQDLVHRDQGESSRATIDDINPPQQWGNQPEFNRIHPNIAAVFLGERVYWGAEAIRACHEAKASSSAVFGFTLKARKQFLNCVMTPGLSGDPAPVSGYETLRWKTLKGKTVSGHSRWETYRPLRFPNVTFITHTVQTPDEVAEAQTIDSLAANAQFEATLLWRGVAEYQTQGAAFRLMWGAGTLSIVFRLGAAPTVERFENNEWKLWKTLEGVPLTTFENGTETNVAIQRIAGRLVVSVDGHGYELLGSSKAKGTARGEGYDLRDVTWKSGGLRVRSYGVSVMVGIAKLLHVEKLVGDEKAPKTSPKGFKPMKGDVERDVTRPGLTPRMDAEAANGTGKPGGWAKDGTKSTIATEVRTNVVRYVCALEASPDGISAPFANKVVAQYLGLFTVDNAPFLDITKACVSGTETTGFPPICPGAEWTIEVDRSALDLIDPNWRNWVKQFNPIEILIRWKYTDHTTSEWVGRFKGYISLVSMKVTGVNKWMLTLHLRDPIMRLQKRHSVIDHNYAPMDLRFVQKRGAPLYGWECVKDIVTIALGENEGNNLIAQFPPFHYPLMSAITDNGGWVAHTPPPTSNKFKFPAPFGSTPIEWIQDFAKMDYAMFFYGHPTGTFGTSQTTGSNSGTVQWPVPIYGQYPLIIAGRPTWVVPDDNYEPGDLNLLAFMGEITGLPEEQINRVLVWSNPPSGVGPDLPFPAVRMAEGTLPDDDPNAAIYSWARTLIHTGSQFFQPGLANYHAERVMALYRGKKIRRYRFECRGEERMQWGDLVMPKMVNTGANGSYSDPHLGVNGERFRIWRLQNSYRFHEHGPEQFKTEATCLPVSALGF